MSDTVYTFVSTCLFGLEKTLGQEIDSLGYKRISTIDGRVTFEGGADAAARCNINLRTAERLYVRIGESKVESFDELFEFVKGLPWEEWIGRNDAFPVKGHSIKSKLFSLPDIQKIIKKAVAGRLSSKYGVEWFEENAEKYQIEFFILNDSASLMIDISGLPLHKRGYRPAALEAPLRETLAACMVIGAHLKDGIVLRDPFCGSGTIPIEAALYLTNSPVGINNRFISESYPAFPVSLWQSAREEAKSLIRRETGVEIIASDLDPKAVEVAKANIRRAGMEIFIELRKENALDITSEGRKGTIICNPPYGERLSDVRTVEKLYRDMGITFRSLDNWQLYILTNDEEFEKKFGMRSDKRKRLYNGMMRCTLYQFYKPRTEKKN